MRKHLKDLVVAAAVAAEFALVLPLQTYLANGEIFPFPAARLLPELLGLFAIFTVGLLLIGFLIGGSCKTFCREWEGRAPARPRTGWSPSLPGFCNCLIGKLSSAFPLHSPPAFFFSLLVAALVCVYLESGILSAGLPELNGGPVPELANRARAMVDLGVWVLIVVGFLAFARRLRPYLHWIALAVLALSLAGLVDVAARSSGASCRGDARRETGDWGGLLFEPQPTVVANVRYSPTRNILIFVLDSMPGKVTIDVLATNATLRAKFPGFTAYPKNIGMHECTKRGVPGLVTGRPYDPAEMSEADYPMTMYAANSFVRTAEAAGWSVAFSPDLLPYGAINLPIEKRVARVEMMGWGDRFAFLRQTTEVPFLSLFDTVAFRLAPFFFKGPILYSRIRHAVKGRHSAEGFWGERTMYPELAARPVSADGRPFLGFFHSWGVHPPWTADFATTVTEKFAALGELFDAYRAAGIYDRSLVIVTSDHGLDGVPPPKGYPPSASALLLVKPEGAAAPFTVSQQQTSHARIAPLVKASLATPQDSAACAATLRAERPLYRAEVREGSSEFFRDWPASREGRAPARP